MKIFRKEKFSKLDLYNLYQYYYTIINNTGGQGIFGAMNCLNYHYNKILNILDEKDANYKSTSYPDKHCKYELFNYDDKIFRATILSVMNDDITHELQKSKKPPCIFIEENSMPGPQGPPGIGVLYIGEITRSPTNQMLLNGALLNLAALTVNSVFLLESNQYIVKCDVGIAAIVDPTDYNNSRAAILANATGPANCFGMFLPGIAVVGGSNVKQTYSFIIKILEIIIFIIIIVIVIYLITLIYNGLVTKRTNN